MAKVYFESTDTAFTVNNNNTTVYGASGDQTVTVIFGVTGLTTDQNIEKVIFSKTSSEYTYKQAGNQIQLYFGGVLVTSIPVQADSDGTELIFANGNANAILTNGVMTIGKASSYTPVDPNTGTFDSNLVIPAPTPTPTPTPDLTPAPDPTPPADTTTPTLTSSTPADNATAVAVGVNIVLTMSENVTAVTGKNITIKKTSDNSIVTTIDAADAQITGSGTSTITINPTSDLAVGTEYYVLIDSGALKDSANNDYAGISSATALSFKTDLVVYLTKIAAGTGGFAINGEVANGNSGYSVSYAGDVNGDGLADLIVGARGNSSITGRSYVVFGKNSDTNAVSLGSLGTGGFVINEEAANNLSGWSVSSAGDVNGDGLADLIVGAPYNSTVASQAGRSYVVFGKSGTTTVELNALGTGGFAINAEAASDGCGTSVSSAGDVNGDGLADLIVSAIQNDSAGADSGRSYVVFGKNNTTAVSPTDIVAGTGGFVINAEAAGDTSGFSVSSAGDVNGDGLADLIVGAKGNSSYTGRSYVVFGKNNTTAVSPTDIAAGTGGFAINGEAVNDYSGNSVSSAGDVNGDGLADLIVGAYNNDTGATNAGRSYVVFGKSDGGVVSLATIATGAGGFAINGEAVANDYSGFSVSSAGDVNGDGLADLIVGAYKNDTGASSAGRSYVVFGKSDGGVVSLSTIAAGTGGFAINGEAVASDESGYSVSSAGDVNGDGLSDLIVGAYQNDTGALS
ncbi:MAG TPA: FG-GAP-like repeat-containing protein, partial [Campylobacterales bacterium]|nr:FG-GAP-like repeat-containing protein [Campylobacterales bacterium]